MREIGWSHDQVLRSVGMRLMTLITLHPEPRIDVQSNRQVESWVMHVNDENGI